MEAVISDDEYCRRHVVPTVRPAQIQGEIPVGFSYLPLRSRSLIISIRYTRVMLLLSSQID
jgi:hypothetical protein